jgi:hypothetical protein
VTDSESNPQQNVQIHWLQRRCILTKIGAEKNWDLGKFNSPNSPDKSAIDLILTVLDYIVSVSFGYILYCFFFTLV